VGHAARQQRGEVHGVAMCAARVRAARRPPATARRTGSCPRRCRSRAARRRRACCRRCRCAHLGSILGRRGTLALYARCCAGRTLLVAVRAGLHRLLLPSHGAQDCKSLKPLKPSSWHPGLRSVDGHHQLGSRAGRRHQLGDARGRGERAAASRAGRACGGLPRARRARQLPGAAPLFTHGRHGWAPLLRPRGRLACSPSSLGRVRHGCLRPADGLAMCKAS